MLKRFDSGLAAAARLSRREVFRVAGLLGLGSLLPSPRVEASADGTGAAGNPGSRGNRAENLRIARCQAVHQLPGHDHGDWRVHGAAGSARRQDARQPAVRPDGRADGRGRQAAGRVDRRRVGHGQRRLRGRHLPCHCRLHRRRQPRPAHPHPRPERLPQGRSHHSDGSRGTATTRLSRRWAPS